MTTRPRPARIVLDVTKGSCKPDGTDASIIARARVLTCGTVEAFGISTSVYSGFAKTSGKTPVANTLETTGDSLDAT